MIEVGSEVLIANRYRGYVSDIHEYTYDVMPVEGINKECEGKIFTYQKHWIEEIPPEN